MSYRAQKNLKGAAHLATASGGISKQARVLVERACPHLRGRAGGMITIMNAATRAGFSSRAHLSSWQTGRSQSSHGRVHGGAWGNSHAHATRTHPKSPKSLAPALANGPKSQHCILTGEPRPYLMPLERVFLSAFRHAAAKGNSNDSGFVKKISLPGLKTGKTSYNFL